MFRLGCATALGGVGVAPIGCLFASAPADLVTSG